MTPEEKEMMRAEISIFLHRLVDKYGAHVVSASVLGQITGIMRHRIGYDQMRALVIEMLDMVKPS